MGWRNFGEITSLGCLESNAFRPLTSYNNSVGFQWFHLLHCGHLEISAIFLCKKRLSEIKCPNLKYLPSPYVILIAKKFKQGILRRARGTYLDVINVFTSEHSGLFFWSKCFDVGRSKELNNHLILP